DWAGIDLVYEAPDALESLAGSLRRRFLRPAEVVGVGRAVADALACLHGLGLTHGRLTAADVLVRPDGSVLLTGYGVVGVLGSAGSAQADVRDLLDMLLACLGEGGAPGIESLEQLLRRLADGPELDAGALLDAL